jgi:hypothetical protein
MMSLSSLLCTNPDRGLLPERKLRVILPDNLSDMKLLLLCKFSGLLCVFRHL